MERDKKSVDVMKIDRSAGRLDALRRFLRSHLSGPLESKESSIIIISPLGKETEKKERPFDGFETSVSAKIDGRGCSVATARSFFVRLCVYSRVKGCRG